ncbi:MAG: GWxTD domain-containing protein [Bacteroidales bacterium]|nr:GWxTD domain-containing protein [Bacteroidales bacterium]MBN2758066.1 GWxTD domain-containing protein [Bacteroidales bacterium]
MIFKNNILIISILAVFLLFSCLPKSTNPTIKNDTQSIYNPLLNRLNPEYFVYNDEMGKSRLYTKIYLNDLMFIPTDSTNKIFVGKIKIEYEVFSPENLDLLIDSASNIYNIRNIKGQNNIITYLNINNNLLKEYYLKITTTDMFRRVSIQDFIFVSTEEGSKQSFIVKSKENDYPYFKNYFRKEHFFSIKHNFPVDSIYIKYFSEELPLPYPPFSSMIRDEILTKHDSIWSVNGKESIQFNESKFGLYFIQTDTTSKNGLALINQTNNFPFIKQTDEMLSPLQYLTSTNEFIKIQTSTNKKLAIDRFWLSCGENPQRTRELIRIYYNRVLYANINFSSFTQGWRTDRGMIYLIFGPPKAVKKTANKEEWIYSDRLNYKMLIFVFNKTNDKFSDNDYVLERNIDFKKFWFESIRSWREGKVYTVFK